MNTEEMAKLGVPVAASASSEDEHHPGTAVAAARDRARESSVGRDSERMRVDEVRRNALSFFSESRRHIFTTAVSISGSRVI
jgi:hypothetical protein